MQRTGIVLALLAVMAVTAGGTQTSASIFNCNWFIRTGCGPLVYPSASEQTSISSSPSSSSPEAAANADKGPCALYQTSGGFRALQDGGNITIPNQGVKISMVGDCPLDVGVNVGVNTNIPVHPNGAAVSKGIRIEQREELSDYGPTRTLWIAPTQGGTMGEDVQITLGDFDLFLNPGAGTKQYVPVAAPVISSPAAVPVDIAAPIVPTVEAPSSPAAPMVMVPEVITPNANDVCNSDIRLPWVACPGKTDEVFQVTQDVFQTEEPTLPTGLAQPVMPQPESPSFKGGMQSWDEFIKQLIQSVPVTTTVPSTTISSPSFPKTWTPPVISSPTYSSPSFPTTWPVVSSPAYSSPKWEQPVVSSPAYSSPPWNPPVISSPSYSSPKWGDPVVSSPAYSSPSWSSPAYSSPSYSSYGSYSSDMFILHNGAMPPCYDRADNSVPADQRIDTADSNCSSLREHSPNPFGDSGSCYDVEGEDEDHDGLANYRDPDCQGPEMAQPSNFY